MIIAPCAPRTWLHSNCVSSVLTKPLKKHQTPFLVPPSTQNEQNDFPSKKLSPILTGARHWQPLALLGTHGCAIEGTFARCAPSACPARPASK